MPELTKEQTEALTQAVTGISEMLAQLAEDPPKEDPPKEDPPKEDPPKEDPPKENPPKENPPRGGDAGDAGDVQKLQRENAALRALQGVPLPEGKTLDDAMADVATKPDGSSVYVGDRAAGTPGQPPSSRAADGGTAGNKAGGVPKGDAPPPIGDNQTSL